MREAILVSHPAPVIHVPRRGRNERLSVARVETPAFLNVLDRDAFRPMVAADGRELPQRLRDGRPWQALRLGSGESRGSLTAETFKAFLRGDLDRDCLPFKALAKGLVRGPLVALVGRKEPNGRDYVEMDDGSPVDVDGSRSVALDSRQDCAAALARFMDEDVAVVDGEVWMRIRPLARYQHDGADHSLTLLPFPHAVPTGTFHLGLNVMDGGVATLRNAWDRPPEVQGALSSFVSALPATYGHRDDIAYLANTLPSAVRRCLPDGCRSPGDPEMAGRIGASLLPAEVAGMTGRVSDGEAPDILNAVHEAARSLMDAPRHGGADKWLLERVLAHLERNVIPRLETPMDVEDEAALAI